MESMAYSRGALEHFVRRSRQLYSLPAVAIQVLELTENEQVDVAALRACIENDPALASKILRVVNSSTFGLSQQVSSLNQALALLGTKPLKLLVLGFSLPKELYTGLQSEALAIYWRRALTKAVAARELSLRKRELPSDEAFIAGLLQDLGLLVLLQELGESCSRLVVTTLTQGGDLAQVEEATLGFEHTVLSAKLLKHWNFPEAIVEAVKSQSEDPPARVSKNAPLRQVVHLSGLLTTLLADRRDEVLRECLEEGSKLCGLGPADLDEVVSAVESQVAQLSRTLSLPLAESESYEEILARARLQLATAAEEAAVALAAGATHDALNSDEAQEIALAVEDMTQSSDSRPLNQSPTAAKTKSDMSPISGTSPPSEKRRLHGAADCQRLLEEGIVRSRRARRPFSLLLVEVEAPVESDEATSTAARWCLSWLAGEVAESAQGNERPVTLGDYRLALILEDCDRTEALEKSRELIAEFQRNRMRNAATPALRIGVASVAFPSSNFEASQLMEAAERCLFAAQAASGSRIKSIDVL